MTRIETCLEHWSLRSPFSISRYTFNESLVATVEVSDGSHEGRGECEPHEYDFDASLQLLGTTGIPPGESRRPEWMAGVDRVNLSSRLPRTPIRNAIDCAMWDMEAKRNSQRAWELAETTCNPIAVMDTIGIDSPHAMARQAQDAKGTQWLKIKVGRDDGLDGERMEAVAAECPGTSILVDVNAGWAPETLRRYLPLAARLGIRVIEQPLPPGLNADMPTPPAHIAFCADESCLDRTSLPALQDRFQFINIKLDKTGGLTEALALRREAERRGLGVMVGMMSGTSLAVAPAFVLAQGLEVVDLELGFLVRDREFPMKILDRQLQPPDSRLWG